VAAVAADLLVVSVEMGAAELVPARPLEPLAQLIQAAVVVVVLTMHWGQAAPASSSSNTPTPTQSPIQAAD
jgi:hypothetical protein